MKKVLNIKVILAVAFIGYLAVTLITTQFELVNKRQQLEILQQQKAVLIFIFQAILLLPEFWPISKA